MPSEFSPILVYALIAAGVTAFVILGNRILGPTPMPSKSKRAPYESGIRPLGDARERFRIPYYVIAMIFLIFDLEIAFVYPWAVVFQDFGWAGYSAMGVFQTIIFVGYIYAWIRGALQWE